MITPASVTPASFLQLFRSFSRSIRRLPSSQRPSARSELRKAYAKPLPESFEERMELFQSGEKRLAFLRMKTGGTPSGDASRKTGRVVFVQGERVEVDGGRGAAEKGGEKARYSNWHGGNLDPESVQRHQRLLNRAGFMNNKDAIGHGGIF